MPPKRLDDLTRAYQLVKEAMELVDKRDGEFAALSQAKSAIERNIGRFLANRHLREAPCTTT